LGKSIEKLLVLQIGKSAYSWGFLVYGYKLVWPSAFNFGEAKPKLSFGFNRLILRAKSIQIAKPLPKIGDIQPASLTFRIFWGVSEILISTHQ
jgi:hypothetical protein